MGFGYENHNKMETWYERIINGSIKQCSSKEVLATGAWDNARSSRNGNYVFLKQET